MKRLVVSIILLLSIQSIVFSQTKDDAVKYELSGYEINDPKIRHVATDISNYIFRRRNGFKWPVTKIIFSQQNNQLKLDIIAVDNEWNKLFEADEKPKGYCVINNRMFILAVREDSDELITKYVTEIENSQRTFFTPSTKVVIKNPKWIYIFKPEATFPTLLNAYNQEVLGR